jgi:hypothetical protein
MVETAMVMTIVVMVLLLVIDLGRAYFTFVSLRNAAREAAIFAGYNPTEVCGPTLTYTGIRYTIAKEMRLGDPADPTRVGCDSGGDVQVDTTGADASGCYQFTAPDTYVACSSTGTYDPRLTYVYRIRLQAEFEPITPFVGALTGNGFGGSVPMAVEISAPVLSGYGS